MTKRLHGVDSLRSLAFIYIFILHSTSLEISVAAPLGVSMFFVISGFLLTYLHDRIITRGAVFAPSIF